MASAIIDGIETRYEVLGSGPALLMFSPGGFDATIEKWRTQGIYAKIKPLDHLPKYFTCIVFDRRETGESGGRVERVRWIDYVAQGKGLLDHLRIDRAHVMGACMGVALATVFGVTHPGVTRSLVLYLPVGGARYRINSHMRFAEHLAYVKHHGLSGVVELARSNGKSFGEDPRGGPWASVIRRDPSFADSYRNQDVAKYQLLVMGMGRTLFDRDSAPGAEPEDLMRLDTRALIVPGQDAAHAISAARYLEECLPNSEYWDVPVEGQTEETAPARLLEFLHSVAV
ncbi:MAG: alpha/beta hydrolase [Vicinamibacterales bacterium]